MRLAERARDAYETTCFHRTQQRIAMRSVRRDAAAATLTGFGVRPAEIRWDVGLDPIGTVDGLRFRCSETADGYVELDPIDRVHGLRFRPAGHILEWQANNGEWLGTETIADLGALIGSGRVTSFKVEEVLGEPDDEWDFPQSLPVLELDMP